MADLYAVQQVFPKINGTRVVSVVTNGGSVVVECEHGAAWVPFKTFSADGAEIADFAGGRTYRFTPSGGATYAL